MGTISIRSSVGLLLAGGLVVGLMAIGREVLRARRAAVADWHDAWPGLLWTNVHVQPVSLAGSQPPAA